MESDIIYLVRQSILQAVSEAFGPTTFERTMRHPELSGAESTLVLGQWKILLDWGYLDAVPGSDGKYIRLTAKGIAALKQRTDPVIHGASAL